MLVPEFKEVRRQLGKILASEKQLSQSDTDHFLVRKCLIENVTFQLPASTANDRWVGFREIVRTTRKIFVSRNATVQCADQGSNVILGGFLKSADIIRQYIEFESGKKMTWYIAKAEWPQMPSENRTYYWAHWLLSSIPFACKCVFSNQRTNWALLIRTLNDATVLMDWLKKNDIKCLYDFLPYELDSNLIALLCRDRGIRVVKIPSSGPLATHNEVMIGDDIVLSSPYQYEEMEKFGKCMRYSNILKWGPERAFDYIARYKTNRPSTKLKTLGFYSHASWIRQEQDHADVGMNIPEAEEKLLADLANFILTHPDYSLRVFLHPREKSEDTFHRTKDYFDSKLGSTAYQMASQKTGTTETFETVDIALAAFSTILFERLFCGYKTMIGNYNIPNFPLKGSGLTEICFDSYPKMESMIEEYSGLTESQFFDKTGLAEYLWSSYPSYQL